MKIRSGIRRGIMVSTRTAVSIVALLGLAACVSSPPVQEMSDARQAIGVAKDAGANLTAAADLREAEAYLVSAQQKLTNRSYSQAKQDALLAKHKALEALAGAEAASQNQPL